MRTRTTLTTAAAALILLPALLTGCSGTGKSAGETPSAGAGGGNTVATKVAGCMRDKGHDYPDPSGDSFQAKKPEGSAGEQWDTDLDDCLRSAGGGAGGPDAQAPGPDPATVEKSKEAAQCLRDAGYEDFPDDDAAQGSYEPSGDQAAFDEAQGTCYEKAFGTGAQSTGKSGS